MAAHAGPDGKFTIAHVAPGSYWLTGIEMPQGANALFGRASLEFGPDGVVYAWDNPDTVEYANPDWMRQHAAAGVPVAIDVGQHATVKITRQTAGSEY